ncbi:MAG: CAP domain-containing protein [Phycisphaerae bacterium]|nr:CAP domain-containing protein [Phycisphaerae bacterium]
MIRNTASCVAILAVGVALSFGTGCGVSVGGGTAGGVITIDPNGDSACSDEYSTAELAAQAVALGNTERAAVGVAALAVDPVLQAVAQAYAEIQAAQGFIGHTDLNGDTVDGRLNNAGYAWTAVGENLAYGPCTAEDVVQGWMNSEGHRTNLLRSVFTHTGLAVYRGGEHRMYWVQVFATPQ